jgi:predicted RNA-binding protein associated with RNAse of E/G family
MLALCYAHWEGSIRYAAKTYLDYIAIKKIRYRDLNPQFTKNIFINRIGNYYQSRPPFQERCSLVEDVLGSGESRFSKADHEIVNTRSNLNSLVLSDICLVCGIDRSIFTEKDHFIDVFLLKRRNEIAHGEGTFIDLDDLDELAEGTIELIRMFGDALENIIYTDAYRKIEPVL